MLTGLKSYYENGEISRVADFTDEKATGEWKIYHENGELYQERLWKMGKLMKVTSCFDNKGNPLKLDTLKNGNGKVYYYFEDGVLDITVKYKKDLEQ
ncbi:MAG: hypothetical protein HRT57_15920 [Crocinitomicaceae bacterium]|nr:hypothetical protein [Crocinitomicaceae bacterium]